MATLTVVTDRFVNLAKAEAEALGHPQLRLLVVPHPFGGVPEAEIRKRAQGLAPKILDVLTSSGSEEEEPLSPESAVAHDLTLLLDETDEVSWALAAMELTDGLPVIPPTADRVQRMLQYCDRSPTSRIGPIPPRWALISIEALASNAVMAGCRPEHFPVVIQALEAMLRPEFNLYGIQATTHPAGPMVLISGPLARELGVAGGAGCLGPGWPANAAIGRAVRLALMNGGGARPGGLDKATMGQPGKFSACFSENEAETPWEPFRVAAGFGEEVTTITVIGAEAPHNINDHGSTHAEGILRTVAGTMATTGHNNLYWQGDTFVILGPEHAATLAGDGLGIAEIQRELHRRARIPVSQMSEEQLAHTRDWVQGIPSYIDDHGRVAVVRQPEDIRLVVAGGPGKHSLWVPTFGITFSVTVPITHADGQIVRTMEELRRW